MSVNFYNGIVADTPSSDEDGMRVSVPNLTIESRVVYGPLKCRPHVSDAGEVMLPTRGDKCVIAVDNDALGEQWIVDWIGSRVVFTIGAGAGVTLDPWHTIGAPGEPAFQNGWVNYGAPFENAAFRKGLDGRVAIRGSIKNGTLSATAFTLPEGYWPPKDVRFNGAVTSQASTAWMQSNISSVGVVYVAGDSNAIISFDGNEFDTDSVITAQNSIAVPLDSWHNVGAAGEPPFQSSWTTVSGGTPAGFRKYPDGKVRLRGLVTGGVADSAIFTLPEGYRPPNLGEGAQPYRRFVVMNVAGSTAQGYIIVGSGIVTVNGTLTGGIDLGTIEFDTQTEVAYAAGNLPLITTRSVGPTAGNGGSVPATWVVLPNLALTYTTPSVQTRAEIKWQVRLDANAAAWTYVYTGIFVSPTPTAKLHPNSVAGGTSGTGTLTWLHNAGQASTISVGFDTVLLAANTFYTFQVMALSSGATWTSTAENYLMATFYPEHT